MHASGDMGEYTERSEEDLREICRNTRAAPGARADSGPTPPTPSSSSQGHRRLVAAFGPSSARPVPHLVDAGTGAIDRRALGRAVFADPALRRRLDAASRPPLALALAVALLWPCLLWLASTLRPPGLVRLMGATGPTAGGGDRGDSRRRRRRAPPGGTAARGFGRGWGLGWGDAASSSAGSSSASSDGSGGDSASRDGPPTAALRAPARPARRPRWWEGGVVVVLDAPLLFESGLASLCGDAGGLDPDGDGGRRGAGGGPAHPPPWPGAPPARAGVVGVVAWPRDPPGGGARRGDPRGLAAPGSPAERASAAARAARIVRRDGLSPAEAAARVAAGGSEARRAAMCGVLLHNPPRRRPGGSVHGDPGGADADGPWADAPSGDGGAGAGGGGGGGGAPPSSARPPPSLRRQARRLGRRERRAAAAAEACARAVVWAAAAVALGAWTGAAALAD